MRFKRFYEEYQHIRNTIFKAIQQDLTMCAD